MLILHPATKEAGVWQKQLKHFLHWSFIFVKQKQKRLCQQQSPEDSALTGTHTHTHIG